MKKIILTMLFGLGIMLGAVAQNRTITGKVVDEKSGVALGLATVSQSSSNSTKSDPDGTFSISVPKNAKSLTVSFIGYEPQTVNVANKSNVTVLMVLSSGKNEDVVVVGYAKRKRKDEAGAITTIKGSDISDMPNASIDKSLQGAAPGVTIQANNGIPGGNIRVNIRGLSSFGAGTAPLWVIDGIPFPSGNLSSFTQTNPLSFLNPSDIETIDILKDAASTAIYGSSGANGVIIVTTKKGKNAKTKIGFNYYTGSNKPLKKLDVLGTADYFKFRMDVIDNQQKLSNVYLTPQQLKATTLANMQQNLLTGISTATLNTYSVNQLDSLVSALPNTDWQDAVFGTGAINNYELTLSGGTEKTQFYTSASYQTNKSIIKKTDFKRANVKIDVTNQVTSKLKVNFNAFLSTIYQNAPFATDGSFLGNPAFSASLILPHNPVYGSNGQYFGLSPNTLMGLLSHNVVAVNDYNVGYERTNEALANISLEYKIRPWLTYRAVAGVDYRIVQGRLFRDPRTPDGFGVSGRGTSHADWFTNLITTHTLGFVKSFKKHNIDGVVGYEFNPRTTEGFSAQKTNFTTYQLPLLTAGGVVVSADEYFTQVKKNGVFASVNYNYDRRYIIGVTGRYDGSSRFGENSKFGFFPSIKAAWNVDNEKFFKENKYITALKIRASYGQSGNDLIGDYDALGTYGSGALYNNQPGIFPNRLASSKLTWEDVKEKNFGVDVELFRSRIKIKTDIYDKLSYNILQNNLLPSFTGWGSVRGNSGRLSNKGVEVEITANVIVPKKQDGFRWTVSFNYAKNNNKILEIINGVDNLDRNTLTLLNKPIGQILTTKYAGVNSATGRPMWYDSLGNLTYIPIAKDRYYAGIGAGGLPPITGGFSTVMSFKNFTLDAQFSYQYGQLLSDGQYNFAMETLGRVNLLRENYDNRWTAPGQVTYIPRANGVAEPNSSGAGTGDRFLQKSDFIRLKNLSLSYAFDPTVLRKLNFSSLVFYVQGGNLFTYTKFKGYDPEFVTTATGIVPQSRNITMGIQTTF
jgi:TonB-dependent starch-binding outer membrane protein SusC